MDLENQKRVKEFTEEYGAENIVVLLGAAEGEAAGLAAETVTLGDPTFAGPLAGVSLKLAVYHICEPEVKAEIDEAVYDEQIRRADQHDGNGAGCRRHLQRNECNQRTALISQNKGAGSPDLRLFVCQKKMIVRRDA